MAASTSRNYDTVSHFEESQHLAIAPAILVLARRRGPSTAATRRTRGRQAPARSRPKRRLFASPRRLGVAAEDHTVRGERRRRCGRAPHRRGVPGRCSAGSAAARPTPRDTGLALAEVTCGSANPAASGGVDLTVGVVTARRAYDGRVRATTRGQTRCSCPSRIPLRHHRRSRRPRAQKSPTARIVASTRHHRTRRARCAAHGRRRVD